MVSRPQHGAFINPVVRALSALVVSSRLLAAGRPEELAGDAVAGISTGILRVESHPISWINVQAVVSGDMGRPDLFSLLYGVSDPRITPDISSVSVRRPAGSGAAYASGWKVDKSKSQSIAEFGANITHSLNSDTELENLLYHWGTGVHIVADPVVDSWVIAVGGGNNIDKALPGQLQWAALERIARGLRWSPLPAEFSGMRISKEGLAYRKQFEGSGRRSDGTPFPQHGTSATNTGKSVPTADLFPTRIKRDPASQAPNVEPKEPPAPVPGGYEELKEIVDSFASYARTSVGGEVAVSMGSKEAVERQLDSNHPRTNHYRTLASINLHQGPIESIEFFKGTRITEWEEPHEAPRYPVSWAMVLEVTFNLEPEWMEREIPGIGIFELVSTGRTGKDEAGWTGNDMGLGIIESLAHSDKTFSLSGGLSSRSTISTDSRSLREFEKESEEQDGTFERSILHETFTDPDLNLTLSNRSPSYEENAIPNIPWPVDLSTTLKERIWGLAEKLNEFPPYVPTSVARSDELKSVPAPKINYVQWLATLPVVIGISIAAWASFVVTWEGRPVGWMVFAGVILSLIAGLSWLAMLNWLGEILGGCIELSGRVERKWSDGIRAPGSLWVDPKTKHFIRVRGLPFMVSSRHYSKTNEGESVTVLFWPSDKRIERLDPQTTVNKYTFHAGKQ